MSQILTPRVKILLVLVLAVSSVLVSDLLSSRKPPHRPAATPSRGAKQPPKAVPPPAAAPQRRLAPPPPPDQPWEQDPFAIEAEQLPRRSPSEDPFSALKISGIVWGPTGYKALVNDKVVRPGDQVHGARIVRITPKGIVVEKDGESRFLPLVQTGIGQ